MRSSSGARRRSGQLPAAVDVAASLDAAADDGAASRAAVHVPEPSDDAAHENAKPNERLGDVLQPTWPALLLQRTNRRTRVALLLRRISGGPKSCSPERALETDTPSRT